MPMLPSSRHVAINRSPMDELLNNAVEATHVHRVLAIQDEADIHLYTDLIWLLPEDQVSQEQINESYLDGSMPRPPGLVPVKSGYRLNQFAEFAANWSVEDKTAFWEFINVRAAHLFAESLDLTVKVQNILRTQTVGNTKLLVAWWDAGLHPAQDKASGHHGELPVWDDYDMLAAIGQMRSHMKSMQLTNWLLDDQMRQTAIWSLYSQMVPQLQHWPNLTTPTRVAAQEGRGGRWLDATTATDRATMHRQCVSECAALWDHFGPSLETDFPEPFEIFNLVVISPEGGEYFNP